MLITAAFYLPEQYARLLATAEDAGDLEPTWQEWHAGLLADHRTEALECLAGLPLSPSLTEQIE